MAQVLMIRETGCSRCGGKGSPREVEPAEMRLILDEMAKPEEEQKLVDYERSEYPSSWSGDPINRLRCLPSSSSVRAPAADLPYGLVRVPVQLCRTFLTAAMPALDWAELCGRGIVSTRAWT